MPLNALCTSCLWIQEMPKRNCQPSRQVLLIMKMTAIILFAACLQVSAKGFGQGITLSKKDAPLEEIFAEIKKQTDYTFAYTESQLNKANPVSIYIKNGPLDKVLAICFQGQPFTYVVIEKTIVLQPKVRDTNDLSISIIKSPIDIRGRVVNESGEPIGQASVIVYSTNQGTKTNGDGYFELKNLDESAILIVSSIGYETKEVNVKSKDIPSITLKKSISPLDDIQIIAYGRTSKRLQTGSVTTITAEEIEKQPISNPLAVLTGKVPGLIVTQQNGNPGGAFEIQIRGQNSIAQGSAPLFLVDGVPYPNERLNPGYWVLANNGQSPFNNINPADIESIEVLKDADATAIYGSRGANGVIMITTKKGKSGTTRCDISLYNGAAWVGNRLQLLDTRQYVAMRKEALANDNLPVNAVTAPDLVVWDTARYFDWQDYLMGKTANVLNANASLSGGNAQTQFMLSLNFNRQEAVYPGNYADKRGTANLNVSHRSLNNRFKAIVTFGFGTNKNELPRFDMLQVLYLPPNHPRLLNEYGALVWEENGITFGNQLAYLKKTSYEAINRFTANINLQYELIRNLHLRITGGYNMLLQEQFYGEPSYSLDPYSSSAVTSAFFGNSSAANWISEPQLEYNITYGKSKFSILAGTSFQNDNRQLQQITATDFANDAVIDAAEFAKSVKSITRQIRYRYQAAFGRINYNYAGKYLLNLTARRDGSSRFGPNKRVSDFGAIGAGWIFSQENFLKRKAGWLSFAKIRGSYGITGNDQIGDYRFLDDYRAANSMYQDQVGYVPSRLYNADFTWEKNAKLELALELGFLNNRLLLTGNWFRNRSSNQLISYKLPYQTGFTSILRNFDALVQNSGWEFILSATPLKKKDESWTLSLNLTSARNKLLEFPGLEASSYASTLALGHPLSVRKMLHYLGVDPATGLFQFAGTSRPTDQTVIKDITPRFYGGITNSITYRNWHLSFVVQFMKQVKERPLVSSGRMPGAQYNQLLEAYEKRWQKPGDISEVQRLSASSGPANTALSNYSAYSDGTLADGSFIRMRTLYLSYSLPTSACSKMGVQKFSLYLQGQNLFTITNYRGLDPETGNNIPPYRMVTAGIQLTL